MQNLIGDCTEFTLRRRRRGSGELRENGNKRSPEQGTGGSRRDSQNGKQESERVNREPQENVDGNKQKDRRKNEEGEDVETDEDEVLGSADRKPNKGETTTEPATTMGYDGWPVIFPGI